MIRRTCWRTGLRYMPRTEAGLAFSRLIAELLSTYGAISAIGDELAADFGLSSARWPVMAAIRSEGKSVAEIARERGLARQSVQRVVDAMRREHLVKFAVNPKHRRAKLVELTPKGSDALARLTERQSTWANEIGLLFSGREMTAGIALMRKVRDSVQS